MTRQQGTGTGPLTDSELLALLVMAVVAVAFVLEQLL